MTIKSSISEIYDLSTSVGQGTVLKVHTPTGMNVKRHLAGLFLQYKKFRYVGAKVTLVPASTLPADPLQLGYEEGEPTIDPRDMVNPILWRFYHGEAMLTDSIPRDFPVPYGSINTPGRDYIGTSLDEQHYDNEVDSGTGRDNADLIYPMCLMDPSFKKAGVQSGFSTFVKPYVYNLVTNEQVLSNKVFTSDVDTLAFSNNKADLAIGSSRYLYDTNENVLDAQNEGASWVPDKSVIPEAHNSGVSVFTNRLTRLGFMDTVTRVWTGRSKGNGALWPSQFDFGDYPVQNASLDPNAVSAGNFALQTYLPNVPMLYVMMPPAYKTQFYFRLLIKHYFEFAGFRSCMNVQSYGTAYLKAPMPQIPNVASTSALTQEIADYIESSKEGGPDSLVIENGEIQSSADGVL